MAKRKRTRRRRARKSNGRDGGKQSREAEDELARRRNQVRHIEKRREIAILKETIRVLEERIHALQGEGCYSTGT